MGEDGGEVDGGRDDCRRTLADASAGGLLRVGSRLLVSDGGSNAPGPRLLLLLPPLGVLPTSQPAIAGCPPSGVHESRNCSERLLLLCSLVATCSGEGLHFISADDIKHGSAWQRLAPPWRKDRGGEGEGEGERGGTWVRANEE